MKRHCRARAVMVLRGKEIAKAFLRKLTIGREDLFRSKFPHHVEKRKHLILLLHEAGLNRTEIARVMGRAPSAITYWTNPEDRERRLRSRRHRYQLEQQARRDAMAEART